MAAASPYDLINEGLARARAGDIAGAGQCMDRALALAPQDPSVLTGRAVIYRLEGRLRDAVLACDAALRIAPDHAGAWLERGTILSTGGSLAMARTSFEQAARFAPGHADAHANLASLAARGGDMAVARSAAERALALQPGNFLAAVALATARLAAGEAQEVLDLLVPLIDREPHGGARTTGLAQLGRACEKLGRYDEAYGYFSKSNEDFAAASARFSAGRMSNTAFIEAIGDGFRAVDRAAWSSPLELAEGKPAPVFLLGYPRSGTTLVENILASIPGVAALEERPTLVDTDRGYLLHDSAEAIAADMARFAAADAATLAPLHDAFWQRVFEAGVPPTATHYVDMDPLKGSRLPFIARLLPEAKIVVMRRDPRDVVWSCFRTDFALTNASLDFVTLEQTARHYDALMRLTGDAMERLPLAIHELRYEALVRDFEGATRALCDFAGLPWTPDIHGFADTARRRGVATASAGQVTKGLYDGSRQWEPYARWLEPVMPILKPWIERYGYD